MMLEALSEEDQRYNLSTATGFSTRTRDDQPLLGPILREKWGHLQDKQSRQETQDVFTGATQIAHLRLEQELHFPGRVQGGIKPEGSVRDPPTSQSCVGGSHRVKASRAPHFLTQKCGAPPGSGQVVRDFLEAIFSQKTCSPWRIKATGRHASRFWHPVNPSVYRDYELVGSQIHHKVKKTQDRKWKRVCIASRG